MSKLVVSGEFWPGQRLLLKADLMCSPQTLVYTSTKFDWKNQWLQGNWSVNRCLSGEKGFFLLEQFNNMWKVEPRSHFKSRLCLIVRVNVGLNSTIVVDSDWRFDNLCGNHLQSQSELYHVSWWYCTLVIDLIGQLRRDVIGRLSVRPWCYWLWRLVK